MYFNKFVVYQIYLRYDCALLNQYSVMMKNISDPIIHACLYSLLGIVSGTCLGKALKAADKHFENTQRSKSNLSYMTHDDTVHVSYSENIGEFYGSILEVCNAFSKALTDRLKSPHADSFKSTLHTMVEKRPGLSLLGFASALVGWHACLDAVRAMDYRMISALSFAATSYCAYRYNRYDAQITNSTETRFYNRNDNPQFQDLNPLGATK